MDGIDSEAVTVPPSRRPRQSVVIETRYRVTSTTPAPGCYRRRPSGAIVPLRKGGGCETNGHASGTHLHPGNRGKCGSQRCPARKLLGSSSHACEVCRTCRGTLPAGGHWLGFVYPCEVGTCGYGYSFGFQHVAYGPRGAIGTWHRAKARPHDVTITFHLTSGTDRFVATLNPHTGTGSRTNDRRITATFTAIENPA